MAARLLAVAGIADVPRRGHRGLAVARRHLPPFAVVYRTTEVRHLIATHARQTPSMDNQRNPGEGAAQLKVGAQGDVIVIGVHGALDPETVRLVAGAASCALKYRSRVRIDLRSVTSYTEAGVAALADMQLFLPPHTAERVIYHSFAGAVRDAARLAQLSG